METAVTLECLSLRTVRHHLHHDALRMEKEFVIDLDSFPSLPAAHACIATPSSMPLAVIGMAVYRQEGDVLHFGAIRVSEPYRRQGLAKRLMTEVITHPANILVRRVACLGTPAGGDGRLLDHLRWLGGHAERLCGTGFTVEEN